MASSCKLPMLKSALNSGIFQLSGLDRLRMFTAHVPMNRDDRNLSADLDVVP